jgi:hypothetical protein
MKFTRLIEEMGFSAIKDTITLREKIFIGVAFRFGKAFAKLKKKDRWLYKVDGNFIPLRSPNRAVSWKFIPIKLL